MKFAAGMTWKAAFFAGFVPFIPLDIVKCIAAVLIAKPIQVAFYAMEDSMGHGGKKKVEDAANVVYEFGDDSITYGEYFIYGKTIEEDYQKTYGSGVWNLEMKTDAGTQTVKDVTNQEKKININRVKVLAGQALEMNISLSDSEKAEIENLAETFYSGLTERDLKNTEITKDLVKKVMEENAVAKKVYSQKIAEYDFEISEEEARMTTFYDLVFECYSLDKDGTVKEFSDEKKATQLEKANEALSSLAQDENVTYQDIVDKYKLKYSMHRVLRQMYFSLLVEKQTREIQKKSGFMILEMICHHLE